MVNALIPKSTMPVAVNVERIATQEISVKQENVHSPAPRSKVIVLEHASILKQTTATVVPVTKSVKMGKFVPLANVHYPAKLT